MPLWLYRDRDRAAAYTVQFLLAGALIGMFFFLTLFFQTILGYRALRSGAAFLPASVGIIVAAVAVSRLLPRLGVRRLAAAGLTVTALGLLWLSLLGPTGGYLVRVLPAMLLLAAGLGLTFVPVTVAAVSGVDDRDAGVASGVLNTAMQIGSAVGLAILATVSAGVTRRAVPVRPMAEALTSGYAAGFRVAAGLTALALVVGLAAFRARRRPVAR
jgi:predicted MFS family arabinose efflux permease